VRDRDKRMKDRKFVAVCIDGVLLFSVEKTDGRIG